MKETLLFPLLSCLLALVLLLALGGQTEGNNVPIHCSFFRNDSAKHECRSFSNDFDTIISYLKDYDVVKHLPEVEDQLRSLAQQGLNISTHPLVLTDEYYRTVVNAFQRRNGGWTPGTTRPTNSKWEPPTLPSPSTENQ